MSEEDNILFVRKNSGEASDDDAWDDSALIKAYDKAINSAKEELSKRLGLETEDVGIKAKKTPFKKGQKQNKKPQNSHQNSHQKKWCIGSPCQAVYSVDGELYEAVIIKIYENTGMCIVKFIGYNNKEKVPLSTLVESEGLQSQIAQQKDALEQNANTMEYEESPKPNGLPENSVDYGTNEAKSFGPTFTHEPTFNSVLDSIPPAPPLPPQLMAGLPENDADALSSMLMSWYMSGFHTGYYHGMKQARNNLQKKTK